MHRRSPIVTLVVLAAALLWTGASSLRAFQTQASFSGTWILNADASTNPNGPATPGAPGGGKGEGGGAGGSGGGGDAKGNSNGGSRSPSSGLSSGPAPGGSLGPDERTRLYAELKVLQGAPKKLGIEASDKQFDLTYEGGTPPTGATFKHVPDGKKQALQTKLGKLDQKVTWTGKTFKRETSTAEALSFTEEYALSADGKQLTVSISVKSSMERIAPALVPPMKRVYDRAQ